MKVRLPIPSGFLFLMLAISPTWARLGETAEECDARYGKPTTVEKESDGIPNRTYQYGDFLVKVAFIDGKSVCEEFKKTGKNLLTMEEAQRLLEVNKQGSDWVLKDDLDDATPESWMRVDGDAKAWTIGNPKCFILVSREYGDRKRREYDETQQQKRKQEEQQLLGL